MRALIVDDDAASLSLTQALVRRMAGLEALCYADPVACVADLDRLDVDVVLLDHWMPGIDGIALIRRLRAHPRHRTVPIIVVTAEHERAVRVEALIAGANDFLTKPLEAVEFEARVVNMLALRRAERDLADRNVVLQAEVDRATATIAAREEEIIQRLARAVEYRDTDTGDHIRRMAELSRVIAEALGFDAQAARTIYLAAFMHDIGKVAVPDAVLFKPGAFTPEERRTMEGHALVGEEILSGSVSPLVRAASEIAGGHHERWDGCGYPRGLAGERIPLRARIAAVADVFDALTSPRRYKRAWSPSEARDYLLGQAGTQFDPACVAALLSRWERALAIVDRSGARLDLRSVA
ncbi:HD-GYP domain-containing protein [Methyloraptor flagellatus]|uniref:HD domain-containing phosphohydrolase n=1 Tax=Methyloraptor flagellatus TaxID=3162530 RepID=A0AAU7XGP3_9HYPH